MMLPRNFFKTMPQCLRLNTTPSFQPFKSLSSSTLPHTSQIISETFRVEVFNQQLGKEMGRLLLFVALTFCVLGWADSTVTKWAVLVAGSSGWKNYRHQANVCHAYQLLKNGGFNDENIIVFMYDDIASHELNPRKGRIYNNPTLQMNVYKGVPKDYTGKHVTAANFYNVILANRSGLTVRRGKVLDSGPNDHIFIYYTDHGGPGKLKACKSASMFEGILPDDINIYATTSANVTELSYGCYESRILGVKALAGRYSISWIEDSEKHNLSIATLDEQFRRVKKRTASFPGKTSVVMKYGTLELGATPVGEFLQSSRENKISAPDVNILMDDDTSLPEGFAQINTAAAKKEHKYEVYQRKRASKNMAKIIDAIFESASDKRKVIENFQTAGKPVVDDWECLKSMERSFETYCGELPACEWKYANVISNLCNNGFSEKYFRHLASVLCPRRRNISME